MPDRLSGCGMTDTDTKQPVVIPIGDNATPIWGMTARERAAPDRRSGEACVSISRQAAGRSSPISPSRSIRHGAASAGAPRHRSSRATACRCWRIACTPGSGDAVAAAMLAGTAAKWRWTGSILRRRRSRRRHLQRSAAQTRAAVRRARSTPPTVPAIERASYIGAYKGVTDLLTKYLWPEWAFWLTRLRAPGSACRPTGDRDRHGAVHRRDDRLLARLVLDAGWRRGWCSWCSTPSTASSRAARSPRRRSATPGITASTSSIRRSGGGPGRRAARPMAGRSSDATFWGVIGVMLFGYVAQRLIEGAFIVRFGMHIHVWQRFDSRFRLVTARRNPNMVILFAATAGRRGPIGASSRWRHGRDFAGRPSGPPHCRLFDAAERARS